MPHLFLKDLWKFLVAISLSRRRFDVFKIDLSIVISILEFDLARSIVNIDWTQDVVCIV